MSRGLEGTFSTELFARYQHSEKALVLALMEKYVEDVSTRKVAEITEVLCGTTFFKSQLSDLAGALDTDLAAWRERPLSAGGYPTSSSTPVASMFARAGLASAALLSVALVESFVGR